MRKIGMLAPAQYEEVMINNDLEHDLGS